MSDTLIAKEIRRLFKAALSLDPIVAEGKTVTVLKTPPAGWVVPDKQLPALYVFASGEGLSYPSIDEVERQLFLDVVLMAGNGGDPADQLDDIQLAVEQIMISAGGFNLARSNRLMSVEIAQNQGTVQIGVRLMKFEIIFGAQPTDPSL